jgi:outer membrane lipoprotein carrier protein
MNRQLIVAALSAFTLAACNAEPPRTGAAAAPSAADEQRPVGGPAVADPAVETPAPAQQVEDPSAGVGAAVPAGPTAQPQQPAARPAPPAAQVPGTQAPAQPAPAAQDEGAAVLQRASAAYGNVRSLRADFVMNFDNPLLRQTTTSRGTIHQRQPDRIALRFTDPDGDVILSDGQYFWVYYPSVNAQQVIRSPAAASGETGVNLQAQFVGNPVERFRYELHGTETVAGRTAHVLTLVPRERADYRSLKVWVDSRDGLVRRFEITEHNGNMRRFDLSNLQVNPTIPESVFRFTPPAGARIVDAG